jgi:uncharacterized RDD family membrane protein YckC
MPYPLGPGSSSPGFPNPGSPNLGLPGPATPGPATPGPGFPGVGIPGPGGPGSQPPLPPSPAALRYAIATGLLPPPRPHGHALAPLSARFMARVIDILAVLVLNAVVNGWFIVQYLREIMPFVTENQRRMLDGESTFNTDLPARAGWLEITILGIACALWFAYEVSSIANSGQTLGKRIMRVRVMRIESQEQLGIRRSISRWWLLGLAPLLWSCCGAGFVLQAIDLLAGAVNQPLHLALHDRMAGTIVVQVLPESKPHDSAGVPPNHHSG